jgi:cyclopropane-fatty-acyl-phospholipid synthase
MIRLGLDLAERGLLPDAIVRLGIRRMLRERLRELAAPDAEAARRMHEAFLLELRRSPVALVPECANEQHYELPARYFEQVLGRRLKYSCGLWTDGATGLDDAEERMLAATVRRAAIEDGMSVLDLGCGWGSFALWLAERAPACRVLAVSNSKPQREFILGRCEQLGLRNLEVVTADVNAFAPDRRFDRVVSVEMFEHVRNHPLLLSRISSWLEPDGRLFVHHFAHREHAYPYEERGDGDWMTRHFFRGGMMPSDDLLLRCQDDLVVESHWRVSGLHYHNTCEAWLANHDARRAAILPILAEAHGREGAELAFRRWRLFFLACSELFGARGGNEWWVTHVRMRPRRAGAR